MKALIFGCGYLGRRVAARWRRGGHAVTAVTRSVAKGDELRAAGVTPVLGDVTDRGSLDGLPTADVVLYAVGFDRASGADRRAVVVEGVRNALDALVGKVERFVFVSTTGVYGQSNGEWIDEESPTVSVGAQGWLAVEAESAVRGLRGNGALGVEGVPSPSTPLPRESGTSTAGVILRMSGLYGPGRLLRRVEQLRTGESIAGDGEAWLNLIHVDDAATAVTLAADRLLKRDARDVETFLVSDDRPVRRWDYYGRLAELTRSPGPVFDASAEGRSVGLGKRCRNGRAKKELGLRLAYPTFEEGLRNAVEGY